MCVDPSKSRGRVFVTRDATGATFVSDADIYDYSNLDLYDQGFDRIFPTGDLILRDGTRYRIVNGLTVWIRDANGNKLDFEYDAAYYGKLLKVKDSLKREVTSATRRRSSPTTR